MTATAAARRVLVIDDDPVIGKSFDRVLSPKGYAVIAAQSGEEALARLEKEDYDVVYTDIKMPGMDGIEVARLIKGMRPWLPVVIVTGYGSDANEAAAYNVGAAGFLRKPLSPDMIEASASSAFPVAAVAAAAGEGLAARPRSVAKGIGMFLAAPFISLAYVIALPFVGIGLIAWIGYRAATGRGKAQSGR